MNNFSSCSYFNMLLDVPQQPIQRLHPVGRWWGDHYNLSLCEDFVWTASYILLSRLVTSHLSHIEQVTLEPLGAVTCLGPVKSVADFVVWLINLFFDRQCQKIYSAGETENWSHVVQRFYRFYGSFLQQKLSSDLLVVSGNCTKS